MDTRLPGSVTGYEAVSGLLSDPRVALSPEMAISTNTVALLSGVGTLDVLPQEVRQMIYGYAFESGPHSPVTLKVGSSSETKYRTRSEQKNTFVTNQHMFRFNILQVSKAMRAEASRVVYQMTPLVLNMNHTIDTYLPEQCDPNKPRHDPLIVQSNKRIWNFWKTAAQFRYLCIRIPEDTIKFGVPEKYTARLLRTTVLLCKLWDRLPLQSHSVKMHLGSMLQEMLPFNMESQASDRYEKLIIWISVWSPDAEPDFKFSAFQCALNLQRTLSAMGNCQGKVQFTLTAVSELEKKDKGGLVVLRGIKSGCEKCGVRFVHQSEGSCEVAHDQNLRDDENTTRDFS